MIRSVILAEVLKGALVDNGAKGIEEKILKLDGCNRASLNWKLSPV